MLVSLVPRCRQSRREGALETLHWLADVCGRVFAKSWILPNVMAMVTGMSTSSEEAPTDSLPTEATEKLLKAIFGNGNPPPGGVGSSLEIHLSAVETRVGQVETRLAFVETKLGTLEAGVARVEAATLRLQENARTGFRLVFGALIATALWLAG